MRMLKQPGNGQSDTLFKLFGSAFGNIVLLANFGKSK